MTPETQIVVGLCRTPISTSARENAGTLIEADLDWDRAFLIAAAFEVEPVFFANLSSLAGAEIPADVLERAAIRERDARAFALSRTLLLVDLYAKLDGAGIPVLVLKGPAVGAIGYGDPSMRTYQDIDFLTTRDALPRARDLLVGLGYTRDYDPQSEASLIDGDHALEFSGPGSRVELHSALIERHLRFDLGGEELWRESITVQCAGAEIKVLDRPRLLLFLCAHGAKHEWVKIRWICDVAQIAEQLDREDGDRVVALAARAHARRLLSVGLGLARDVLGQDLSSFPPEAVAQSSETESIMRHVLAGLGVSESTGAPDGRRLDRVEPGARALLFWARSRERWLDRVAAIARVIFVPTERDAAMGPLGWISRPLRLTARIARRSVAAWFGLPVETG